MQADMVRLISQNEQYLFKYALCLKVTLLSLVT